VGGKGERKRSISGKKSYSRGAAPPKTIQTRKKVECNAQFAKKKRRTQAPGFRRSRGENDDPPKTKKQSNANEKHVEKSKATLKGFRNASGPKSAPRGVAERPEGGRGRKQKPFRGKKKRRRKQALGLEWGQKKITLWSGAPENPKTKAGPRKPRKYKNRKKAGKKASRDAK